MYIDIEIPDGDKEKMLQYFFKQVTIGNQIIFKLQFKGGHLKKEENLDINNYLLVENQRKFVMGYIKLEDI